MEKIKVNYKSRNFDFYIHDTKNIIHWLVKPDNTHLSTYGCIGTNAYGQMWYDKKIYNKK